ncbi:MAG: diguanylate cyclase, partial [Rhodospirillaceae bacterium]|nr:diguanylate cyclase [Rhodospirillaceae bacterium]
MDIDHFKAVNDTHGHAAGDEVLKEFAARIKRCVRFIDLAARTGGEEFVVIMPDSTREACMAVAERLREAIEEAAVPVPDQDIEIPITVSIGVTVSLGGTDKPATLLRRGDDALYTAKNTGRNRAVFYEEEETTATAQGA